MPRIETDPGSELREVWVYLTEAEAQELRSALNVWAEGGAASEPGWHTHIQDQGGREVTVAVGDPG